MMTDEQLAEIKARAAAATPGKWHNQITDDGYLRVSVNPDDVNGICGFGDMEETDYQDHADARFIAHARADIPLLLLEIERLRAEVERLTLRQAQGAATPKPGFLTWLNQVADLLPPGTVIGVKVEELGRWYVAGMTVEGAAERVKETG